MNPCRSRCCPKSSQPSSTAAMCLYRPLVVICGMFSIYFTTIYYNKFQVSLFATVDFVSVIVIMCLM